MNVEVHQTGPDPCPGGIDRLLGIERPTHSCDAIIVDQDIGLDESIDGQHQAVADCDHLRASWLVPESRRKRTAIRVATPLLTWSRISDRG